LVAALYAGLMLAFYPLATTFELDPDEGVNVIKPWLMRRGESLHADIWSDQPPLFSYLLWACFSAFGWEVEHGRVLVLSFTGLLLFGIYDFMRVQAGHRAAACSVALLAGSSYFLPLSVSIMLGMPSLSLAFLALWAMGRCLPAGGRGWLVLSGVLMGLSLATKLHTAFLVPLLGGWLLACGRGSGRSRRGSAVLWLLCVSATAGGILLTLTGWAEIAQLHAPHTAARLSADASGYDDLGLLKQNIRDDAPLFLLAVIGTGLIALQRRWTLLILPAWVATALLLLWGHSPLWYHHHLLLTVGSAPLAGLAAADLLASAKRAAWRNQLVPSALLRLCTAASLLLLGTSVSKGLKPTPHDTAGSADRERYALEVMREYRNGTRTVVTDRPMFAFRAGYAVPPNLAVMSRKRIATGNLTSAEVNDTILASLPEQVLLTHRLPTAFSQQISAALPERYRLIYSDPGQLRLRLYVREDIAGDPLRALLAAAERVPNVARAHDVIGTLWAARGEADDARAAFERAHTLDPDDVRIRIHLADAHLAAQEYTAGFALLRQGLDRRERRRYIPLARHYAWRRATCPSEAYRDGLEAEAMARSVVQLSGSVIAQDLAIIGAALAARGEFAAAAETLQQAVALSRRHPASGLTARLERQRAAHNQGQPWIDPVQLPSY
jgi:tetratricopeptide (TPR) repeat protein